MRHTPQDKPFPFLILTDLGKDFRGGQRQVLYLARHLKEHSELPLFLAAPGNSPLAKKARDLGIFVHGLPSRLEYNPLTLFSFLRLLKSFPRERQCIIQTNDSRSASLGAMARKNRTGRVALVHARRVSYPLKPGWSTRKYARAEAVVAVSGDIRQGLIQSGLEPSKVRVIHSGVDPALYSPRQGSSGDTLVLGVLGALTLQKGHHVLLHGLRDLADWAEKHGPLPDWRVEIAGDGPLRSDLKRLVGDLCLRDRVTFLGYQESRDILPRWDCLVVPSVNGEGSSGVIKEAWATELPVVASDLPGNLELVEPDISGLVFKNRDHRALAAILARLLTDRDLGQALVKGGRARLEQFTVKVMAQAWVELFQELSG